MVKLPAGPIVVVCAWLQIAAWHDQSCSAANTRLQEWERGVLVQSVTHPEMKMYLWFYEWHMFGAVVPEQHTRGNWTSRVIVTADGRAATVVSGNPGIRLEVRAAGDGAEMQLHVTNRSRHDWPDLAAIIPCFNPGPQDVRNPHFANTRSWFLGPKGLAPLAMRWPREIHFNTQLAAAVDAEADRSGTYVWSAKWPKSAVAAAEGLIVRESTDGEWVTGIAWDRFLSCQGHNPWECMHLSVRVGPLLKGESRQVRGRIYLFPGKKEELLKVWRNDFASLEPEPEPK